MLFSSQGKVIGVIWPPQINLWSAEECTQSLWRIIEARGLHQSQHRPDAELSFTPLGCVSMPLNSWLSTVDSAHPGAVPGQQEAFQASAHQHSPPQGLCYHRAMEDLTLKTQKHIGFPNDTFFFLFPLSPIISSLNAFKRWQRVISFQE